MNLYGYAGGDPINNSDPFGLCPEPGSEGDTGEPCFEGAAAFGTVLFGAIGSSRLAVGRLASAYRHAQAIKRVARESAFADGAPIAENGALQNAIGQLFRGADNVPGGTAGAVRMEIITGKPVGGKFHTQKAAQRIVNLQRILKREKLSNSDRDTAQRLLDDLQGAMNTKP